MNYEEAKNEVLRKIGRNILLFQQLEATLKHLVTNKELSGSLSTIRSSHKKRSKKVGRLTLGNVAGAFFENPAQQQDSEHEATEHEAHFKITFEHEFDHPSWQHRKQTLADLIAERNELVHHFLNRVKPGSRESMREAADYLDGQFERTNAEFKFFRELIDQIKTAVESGLPEAIEQAFREVNRSRPGN